MRHTSTHSGKQPHSSIGDHATTSIEVHDKNDIFVHALPPPLSSRCSLRRSKLLTEHSYKIAQLVVALVGNMADQEAPTQHVGPEYRSPDEKPKATVSKTLDLENLQVLPQTPQLIALLTYVKSTVSRRIPVLAKNSYKV